MRGGPSGDIVCTHLCILRPKYQTTISMFNFLKKDPTSKLQKKYNALLEKAMNAQRSGDIKLYARLTAESEEVWKEIEKLKSI